MRFLDRVSQEDVVLAFGLLVGSIILIGLVGASPFYGLPLVPVALFVLLVHEMAWGVLAEA